MFINKIRFRYGTKVSSREGANRWEALVDKTKVSACRLREEHSVDVAGHLAELLGHVGVAIAVYTGEVDEGAP